MSSNLISVARDKGQHLPRRSALPTVLTVAIAIVSSVSLLLLVQTSGMTTTGYDVKRLAIEKVDWQQANYQLESETANLQSLNRIEKEAKGRLHMTPATEYMFVSIAAAPNVSGESLSPPLRSKLPGVRQEDDGWSQQLLDWLGLALGFRPG
ncbi:MAG: hypothetical protein Q7O66_21760 [Dehalococcoidia bacterium]|nr:hypothetical protein [Dehalococcoidia bacterium]